MSSLRIYSAVLFLIFTIFQSQASSADLSDFDVEAIKATVKSQLQAFAEDDFELGWKDLLSYNISNKDVVVGIAASGTTPYVIGALKKCQANKIVTSCIVCNSNSKVASFSDYPIEVIVGPEFVTGSTRMKAGTAQKLVLNMITTSSMIKIGKVIGNKMVDMQLSNSKLIERGTKMIMNKTSLSFDAAKKILIENGSVRNALNKINE